MQIRNYYLGLGLAAALLSGCGAASTAGTETASTASTSSTDAAAAAVASLFSSGAGANIAKAASVESQSQDLGDTCNFVAADLAPSTAVQVSPYRDPGAFGSVNALLNVDAAHFCTQPDGTPNEGAGPDGEGKLAAFEITGQVTGDCNGTTILMQSGSVGVWRNTDSYEPQIWGQFNFDVEGESLTLDCTLYLQGNGQVAYADCSDQNGNTVVQDSSEQCQFNDE
ncbi:MAG: hypothetical protein HY696_02040 [Deltaproteobacteria bacterium]|nr:hypothetical protein [Deltaproteobacteria bacterium]